jgi:hypothetical protein
MLLSVIVPLWPLVVVFMVASARLALLLAPSVVEAALEDPLPPRDEDMDECADEELDEDEEELADEDEDENERRPSLLLLLVLLLIVLLFLAIFC